MVSNWTKNIPYRPRTLDRFLARASEHFPVILVTGPRQTGKTTLLRHLSGENRSYVTLDDPLLCRLAREDPALFLQRFSPPILIDEIQYAPQLLPHIKMAVDEERLPGRFWLTGSQQFHLMQGASESLAGRVGVVNLLGFSRRELEDDPEAPPFLPTEEALIPRDSSRPLLLPQLYRNIWLGSFPALWQGIDVDRDLFYGSYVKTYLQRDFRDLAQVGDEGAFLRFLRACAARTSQILNIQDLCRDADINHATGKRWLSILQNSGVVYLLEPYHSNINKRLVKTPKIYLLDTGLAAYLTEWSSPEALEAGAMSGAILESWVVGEIIKSWWHKGKPAPLFYYRDKDTKEVDLLIHQDGVLYPVEIKKTASPAKDAIRHMKVLKTLDKPLGSGCVISLAPRRFPLSSDIEALPVGFL